MRVATNADARGARRPDVRADAPGLLDVEATQTLRGLVRGGRISLATAELCRVDLGDLGLRRHPDAGLLRRAWELRDVCTTCDGLYVALAEALDAALMTRDARLGHAGAGLVEVVPPDSGAR
jgi:predicted nucleic acid-binding protein